ncbi:hypothetical protein ACOKM3_08350 [Streptomyces sp. BH106]|uniref:hypothetical protein n=1 Tax=Streptomyces sp. BH106 TaxID=3410409 RepID=UPI003CE8029C
MHSFPRPLPEHLDAERSPVEGSCPECGAQALATYRVLGNGGWWEVRKCQRCLASAERLPGPLFGAYTPLGLSVTARS